MMAGIICENNFSCAFIIHVNPTSVHFFSDTGTFPPESCVFTLFLNCAAVVGMSKFTINKSVKSFNF